MTQKINVWVEVDVLRGSTEEVPVMIVNNLESAVEIGISVRRQVLGSRRSNNIGRETHTLESKGELTITSIPSIGDMYFYFFSNGTEYRVE